MLVNKLFVVIVAGEDGSLVMLEVDDSVSKAVVGVLLVKMVAEVLESLQELLLLAGDKLVSSVIGLVLVDWLLVSIVE